MPLVQAKTVNFAKPARKPVTDDNWISNDLDNKIKHFEEVRKGFIEEMTNQMSKALVRQDDQEKQKEDSEEDLDAEELRHLMNGLFYEPYKFMEKTDSPGKEVAVRKQYLIEPMFVNVAINLNTFYTPAYKEEPFRYNIAVVISNVIANVRADVFEAVIGATQYLQMYSFREELRKFRPRIRI